MLLALRGMPKEEVQDIPHSDTALDTKAGWAVGKRRGWGNTEMEQDGTGPVKGMRCASAPDATGICGTSKEWIGGGRSRTVRASK